MRHLANACREVDASFACMKHFHFPQLRRMFRKLSADETEYLTDYIIYKYSPFSYESLISYFGSYDKFNMAVRSNTGSEYDLHEDFTPESDIAYCKMIEYLKHVRGIQQVRKMTVLHLDDKISLARDIQKYVSASMWQICRFLHIIPKS